MTQEKFVKDFFISYTSADRRYAEWIASTLKNQGFSIIIDKENFSVGRNFVDAMDEAIKQAKRIIAVCTPDYFLAQYTAPEWSAALAQDPVGRKGLLIPIKVRSVEITGLLKPMIYIDLTDLIETNKEEAKLRLINGIKTVTAIDRNETDEGKRSKHRAPEYLLGLLNRKSQFEHFDNQIPERKKVSEGRAHGFCLIGLRQEWPNAIRFKLSHLLEEHKIQDCKYSPEIVPLQTPINLNNKALHAEKAQESDWIAIGETCLWKLLAHKLNCAPEEAAILNRLQHQIASHIFYRELSSDEVRNKAFITGMLSAWSKLVFGGSSPSHFLLIICESDYLGDSFFNRIFLAKPAARWHQQMQFLLHKYGLSESLLPALCTPTVAEDVENWFKDHNQIIQEEHRTKIRKALKGHSTIPLGNLKEKIFPILQNHHSQ